MSEDLLDALLPDASHRDLLDHLDSLHQDMHPMSEADLAEPVITRVQVSSTLPLRIDKQDRRHLYLLSAVPLTLFYSDLAGQSGNSALPPLTIPAGAFKELPFQTGDELVCPSVSNTTGIVVYLLAQQQVLAL